MENEKIISGNENVIQNIYGDNNTTVGVVEGNLTINKVFENLKALENLQASGDIIVGNITQIYQIISNLDNIPKPTGFPQNIPNSSTDKFVGREGELSRLHQQLQCNNEVVIAALEGMGGVGKTELAIQYSLLHLQLRDYPGGIFWLRATEADIGLQIVNFTRTDLGLLPPEDLELLQQVRWCWKHWRDKSTLVVLDDVKNYSNIKPYLPPQPSQFKVLITTRLKLSLAGSLYLSVLPESDALQLLTQLVGEEKVNHELEKATELCQRLGYLPLALQLVGRYLKKRKILLAQMLQRLEEKGLGHPSLVVKENDPTWTLNIKQGVAAAFELSCDQLSKEAKQLGCLLSLFALAPIPWSLVETVNTGQEIEELEEARDDLEDMHLLQGNETYHLHQLIREFFKEKLAQSEQKNLLQNSFCQAMIAVAKQVSESFTQLKIQAIAPTMPHVAEILKNRTMLGNSAFISDDDFCLLFVGIGRFFTNQGLYKEAKLCYENYLSNAKERFGEDSLEVASSQNSLANTYKDLGYYDDAEIYYQQALNLSINKLGDNHLDVATIMNNLALLYSQQNPIKEEEKYNINLYMQTENRYLEARNLFRKSLKIRQFHLRENHPIVAQSLNHLGTLYAGLARYSWRYYSYTTKAERLLKKAFDIRKHTLNVEHPDIGESLNNLACLYTKMYRYSEAESFFFQALALNRRLLGETHPVVALGLWNLGELYVAQYEYNRANSLFQQSLEILHNCLENDHPLIVSARKILEELRYRME
ncbi:MAG: tetratricopeptide repeat protein [Scytonematopsis contorta HA4267-MV1]|jgi:tetratricopeptide (TPR) repeat protein|nr:tetratricopeptide repeat protein [Scytonematopsis contorta HA4267-MV1]